MRLFSVPIANLKTGSWEELGDGFQRVTSGETLWSGNRHCYNGSKGIAKALVFIGVEGRTREGPIRTASLIPVRIKVPIEQTIAVYQKLSPKIKEMKALGMSYRDIAVSLGIDKKTVGRALSFNRP